jgi:hypothetical protein
MKKLFEKHLKTETPITEEVLEKFQIKKYFNGEDIRVGDVVLFALLMYEPEMVEDEENGDYPHISLKFIRLNKKHFDLFEYDKRLNQTCTIPVIKLKNNNILEKIRGAYNKI